MGWGKHVYFCNFFKKIQTTSRFTFVVFNSMDCTKNLLWRWLLLDKIKDLPVFAYRRSYSIISFSTTTIFSLKICTNNKTFQINFVLFITFTRVLCMKLNSMYIQQRRLKYKKLTKSILILVPLFGVPYAISLILVLQTNNEIGDLVYLFFDQTFTSFQVSTSAIFKSFRLLTVLGFICCHNLLPDQRRGWRGAKPEVPLPAE